MAQTAHSTWGEAAPAWSGVEQSLPSEQTIERIPYPSCHMKSSSDLLFTKKHFGLLAIVREGTPAKSLEFEPNSWQLIFPHSHFQNVPHIWDGEANDLQRSFLIIFLSFWTVTLPNCFPIFPKIFCTTKCHSVPWEITNISCQCFLKNMFFFLFHWKQAY